ncbi:hypothetical protein SUGI_0836460 [Cryptomeria japonica]|uniref:polygalacturonase At1g48100-like n=1 Tax=Cryptomeria japonica TaxID=3369 RepID=UPI002414BB6B|nr:polygalacturonase At1g48100-like [Cryptomeria japonica]GLJ40545.1 hypothetical protein SUGI_0836460 [Cryptomeria japonica]
MAKLQTTDALLSSRCLFLVFALVCLLSSVRDCNAARVLSSSEPPSQSFANDSSSDDCDQIFNVQYYGAVGDGVTDDTEAFQLAWQAACEVESAVVEVPQGYSFMIQSTIFSGPCKGGLSFQVDGVLLAPDGPDCWNENSSKLNWIVFYKLQNFTLQGKGLIDGNGQKWWDLPCKPHKGPNGTTLPGPCESPTAIKFFDSSNVTLRDLRIRNSPQMHLRFDYSKSVVIDNIIINTPALSPNTDGIHVSGSQSVGIYNSAISTGDDCISIVSGAANVDIRNVTCGPSHGISIGGLGNHNSQGCVCNISVSDVVILNSDNGLRIKTWQGGLGSVSGVTFDNVYVENVRNPIIIDQFYCFSKGCHNATMAVYVSDIAYRGIRGTYDVKSPAMHFACSDTIPCTNITLANIELLPAQGQMIENPFCWNAYGSTQTLIIPPLECLQEGKPHSTIQGNIDSCSY